MYIVLGSNVRENSRYTLNPIQAGLFGLRTAEGGPIRPPLRKIVNNDRRTTKFHTKVYHDVNYILGYFMTSSPIL